MNSIDCILECRRLEIVLRVRDDDAIGYRPESRMPPKLLASMTAVKDELKKDILMSQALDFLGEKYVPGANLSVLDEPGERVNEAYAESMPEFREALREYVRAGLREFRRAGRSVA